MHVIFTQRSALPADISVASQISVAPSMAAAAPITDTQDMAIAAGQKDFTFLKLHLGIESEGNDSYRIG